MKFIVAVDYPCPCCAGTGIEESTEIEFDNRTDYEDWMQAESNKK